MPAIASKPKQHTAPKLSAKEAAQAAAKYLRDLIILRGSPVVEEVEFEDGKWLITLGFYPGEIGELPSVLPLAPAEKEFKLFAVDAQSGEVSSMKIRTV